MEPMKSRTLEVTVLSAEDLRVDGKPVTKNVYVVVRAESINSYTTTMKGESFPSWNETFLVDMATHARSITFEVKCKTATGVVKDVGVARMAVSDFLGEVVSDNCLKFLSYRLRDWEGSRNGIIHFSVKARTPEYAPTNLTSATEKMISSCGLQMDAKDSSINGVVTGIPVWWNNYTNNI